MEHELLLLYSFILCIPLQPVSDCVTSVVNVIKLLVSPYCLRYINLYNCRE